MDRAKKILRWISAWTWELPQNLIGGIIALICREKTEEKMQDGSTETFHHWKLRNGISLGAFRFVPYPTPQYILNHEYGHSRQSLYLGPLYLLVIGLPSIIWYAMYNAGLSSGMSYYDFYTEAWADRLGGNR